MSDKLPILMSSSEAADYLGINYTRVNAIRRSGKIRGIKIGRAWAYTQAELDQYAAIRKTGRPKGYSPKRKQKDMQHDQNKSEE